MLYTLHSLLRNNLSPCTSSIGSLTTPLSISQSVLRGSSAHDRFTEPRPNQYSDLEDSMTDALVNNKPQFVRLFTENGLNILDYLTYKRLEGLYSSVSDSSLAYMLLQRRLSERRISAGSMPSLATELDNPQTGLIKERSNKEFTLYEVRKVVA